MDIAILGYGIVGSGTAELLLQNNDEIVARSMQNQMRLTRILDLRTFPGDRCEALVTHDFNEILNDSAIGIVAETMGGLHPAFEYVQACLAAGKSVVTSNKELVAKKGFALLQTAREHNVNFLFEASVGGGIPVLRPISQCLAANRITEIAGILNGTTNFILTRMVQDAMPFATALQLAQERGYAERDPSADIDGHDACRKICILATLAFGRHIYPDYVPTEGIASLQLEDVLLAEQQGYGVKLLGHAALQPSGHVQVFVAPQLVPKACLLAGVNDVYNAVLVRGNAVEDVLFYGRGAGKFPTASAVVADIIDCAKHTQRRRFFGWQEGDASLVAPLDQHKTQLYVRAKADDEACAALQATMPEAEIWQNDDATLVFLTPHATEGWLRAQLAAVPGLQVLATLRVAML